MGIFHWSPSFPTVRQSFCPALLFTPGSTPDLYVAVNGRCVPAARAYKTSQPGSLKKLKKRGVRHKSAASRKLGRNEGGGDWFFIFIGGPRGAREG